jgi:hypothetical protein
LGRARAIAVGKINIKANRAIPFLIAFCRKDDNLPPLLQLLDDLLS